MSMGNLLLVLTAACPVTIEERKHSFRHVASIVTHESVRDQDKGKIIPVLN
jgi:hypothetical protein